MPTDWRTLAWRRNGALGTISRARNACERAINPPVVSKEDIVKLKSALELLNEIIFSWDKHYIKKLKQQMEVTKCQN